MDYYFAIMIKQDNSTEEIEVETIAETPIKCMKKFSNLVKAKEYNKKIIKFEMIPIKFTSKSPVLSTFVMSTDIVKLCDELTNYLIEAEEEEKKETK